MHRLISHSHRFTKRSLPFARLALFTGVAGLLCLLTLTCVTPALAAPFQTPPRQLSCTPDLYLTLVPKYGTTDPLYGRVDCVNPPDYMVAIFIFAAGGWWNKPTWANSLTPIAADGSWSASVTTGGVDTQATSILACLLPKNVAPPTMSGQPFLPSLFLEECIDIERIDRAPSFRTISFAGYPWQVKSSPSYPIGPGPNYFSDSSSNVWVDTAGQLHLKLTGSGSYWYAAEVINMASLGYGTYTFITNSAIDELDPNVVLGLFTWDTSAPAANYREIDAEFSRWGDPAAANAQYVVQPYTTSGNRHRFSLSLPGARAQHTFSWRPEGITFTTAVEDPAAPGAFQPVHTWPYAGASNPAPGAETPRINLWLLSGRAPTDGNPVEVVVEDFKFTPLTGAVAMASVSRTGIGDGKVTANQPGIDCGFDCGEDYPIGTTITLSATAFAGSLFAGWNGACTGATPTCTITLDSAHAVTATFQPRMQYRLTTQVAGGAPGSVKVDPPGIISTGVYTGDFAHGTRVTLTATPAPESAFLAWYYGCTNSTAPTCTFTMTSAMNVYAYFKPRRDITVTHTGDGAGRIVSSLPGIDCTTTCSGGFPAGAPLSLLATPEPGSIFLGWSGNCGAINGNSCSWNPLSTSTTVTATFSGATHPLKIALAGDGHGLVQRPSTTPCTTACEDTYAHAAIVVLSATPQPGSAFAGWSGACSGVDLNCTLTMNQGLAVTATFALNGTPLVRALGHLDRVMDQYHDTVDVYTDLGAAGNHFAHRGAMGFDPGLVDEAYTGTVHSGATSIRVMAPGPDWGGWYFQNGILTATARMPSENWGTVADAGVDLTGATALTFYARGAVGGERVQFFAFGVGRNPASGEASAPYPDSEAKVTTCGRLQACWVTLNTTWQPYTITLTGLNLSYVLGAFGWVTDPAQNNGKAVQFLLDDIQFQKSRLDEPRFMVSYQTRPTGLEFDTVVRNVAFSYDNALALMAFTAAGDQRRAGLIADAFVYAQQHDRSYSDGRMRNAYQAGDLVLPPGWEPHERLHTVRMPGWWDTPKENWFEDVQQVSSYAGDMSWVLLALLNYYEAYGGDQYRAAAVAIGNWIESNTRSEIGPGGYTGGARGWEPAPINVTWKSTEHNLDLYVAFARLAMATGNPAWWERSDHARRFVEAMWNDAAGHYWTGTTADGITPSLQAIPLDAQSWALLAFGPTAQTRRAIDFATANHLVTANAFKGFDFDTDRDQPWFEGTSQMALAYAALGRDSDYAWVRDELRRVQVQAPNANDLGIVAAIQDGLTTGFDWKYFNRLHVGATAWFIFQELQDNPYWPGQTPAPQISSFTPVAAPVATPVLLQGAGFTGARAVRFNGKPAPFAVLSDTQISTTVPPSATSGTIEVVSLAGARQSATHFSVTTPACYMLTRIHSGSGQVPVATPDRSPGCPLGAFVAGTAMAFAATPEYGFTVLSWSGTDNDGSTALPNTLTMPARDHTVGVTYGPLSIPDLIFVDGFESGGLNRWSTAAVDNNGLTIARSATMAGVFGMSAIIDDNHPLYVVDRTPSALKRYRARFHFNPNGIQMAGGNAHTIFRGFNPVRAVLAIELVRTGSDYGLRASLLNDNLKWVAAPPEPIDGLPVQIEIDWKAASSSAIHDGYLDLWINNVLVAHTESIDNDQMSVDTVWLGPQAGIDNDTRGVYFFDEFESHESSPIGPVSAAPKRSLAAPAAPQTITAPEAPIDPDGALAAAPRGGSDALPSTMFEVSGATSIVIASADPTAGKIVDAATPKTVVAPIESATQIDQETVSQHWLATQPIALQLASTRATVELTAPAGATAPVSTTLTLSEEFLAPDNYLPVLPAIIVDFAGTVAEDNATIAAIGANPGAPIVLPIAGHIRLSGQDEQSLTGVALLRLAPDRRTWEPAGYTTGKDDGEITFGVDRTAVFLVARPLYGDAYPAYLPIAIR